MTHIDPAMYYPPYGCPCNTCGATISGRQQRKHAEWHRKYMPMEPLVDVELPEPRAGHGYADAFPEGPHNPDVWKVICTCGWEVIARPRIEADRLLHQHIRGEEVFAWPHRRANQLPEPRQPEVNE